MVESSPKDDIADIMSDIANEAKRNAAAKQTSQSMPPAGAAANQAEESAAPKPAKPKTQGRMTAGSNENK